MTALVEARVLGVVEVAEDDEVGVGVGGEAGVNLLAQQLGFFEAQLGFVGLGDGALGLEVGSDEGERVVRVHLDIHLGKAAADAEAASAQQEAVVVRAAGGDREFAEDGDVDVGVEASDVLPIREVESVGLQGVAQFQQRIGAAHLLQGEHVGFEGADALADFGLGLGGLGGAGLGALVEVVSQRCRWRRGRSPRRRTGRQQQGCQSEKAGDEHGGNFIGW